jgi:hypothetical protein
MEGVYRDYYAKFFWQVITTLSSQNLADQALTLLEGDGALRRLSTLKEKKRVTRSTSSTINRDRDELCLKPANPRCVLGQDVNLTGVQPRLTVSKNISSRRPRL